MPLQSIFTKKTTWTVSAVILLIFCVLTINVKAPEAQALSGSEFQAGRIIDDGVFFNGLGLSALQVQQFLDSKVPICDTNGTQPYSGTTAAAYGTSRGYPPPYTCLKDYRQTTPLIAADDLCNGLTAGNKSAAEIIFEVGRSCGINQKVILVTLQKEQSLISDDWPWSKQFDKATGYACPDNPSPAWPTGCDPDFAGFANQVYYGARQFKRYARDTHIFTSFKPGRINSVLYHPNASCGRSDVFIQNQATSGLYTYTPYQPNSAALANLYGTGDSCSAYGNRNFWRLFNDWFGTTYSDLFSASFHSQSSGISLYPGESKTVHISYRNNGNWDWHDDGIVWPGIPPIHLAATNAINRSSIFSYGWPSAGRPAFYFNKVYEADGVTLTSNQHLVKPGQIARFEFTLTAPWVLQPGNYREFFQPVLEGSSNWNIGGVAWLDINVIPRYSATFHSQSAYPTISSGQRSAAFIAYRNTGGDWWYDSTSRPNPAITPIHLAATNAINRSSIFSYGWPSAGRPAVNFSKVYEADGVTLSPEQNIVKPGQIGRFEFDLSAPWTISPGTRREYFQPVAEGATNWRLSPPGYSWLDVRSN